MQRGPVGTAPFQLPFAGTAGRSHRHPDVVLDQIAQHPANGSEALEQVEHLADRALRLFVRIQHHLAGRAAPPPGRPRSSSMTWTSSSRTAAYAPPNHTGVDGSRDH
jgi:hypothetical protein